MGKQPTNHRRPVSLPAAAARAIDDMRTAAGAVRIVESLIDAAGSGEDELHEAREAIDGYAMARGFDLWLAISEETATPPAKGVRHG